MSTVLRVRLVGEDADLGRVAARDVARLLLGVERAVARAASHVAGHQVKATGRRRRSIEETTRFKLLGIERGSVVGVLELPQLGTDEDKLDLGDASLGELAVESTFATAAGAETRHVDVADALVQLADEVGIGSRFDALLLEEDRLQAQTTVTLDRAARDRLFKVVSSAPEPREEGLIAVLVEADFENHTARLRTAAGQRIAVRFDPDLADDIYEGLRRQAEFLGEVSYDPKTMEAKAVELRRIVTSEQLVIGLEAGDFWSSTPIQDLAAERGIGPVTDADDLRDREASDDEVDRLLGVLDAM